MFKVLLFYITINFFLCPVIQAQKVKPTYAANTTKQAREKEYRYLIGNSINKNLLIDLTDSTEENWQEAITAMELLNYRTAFIDTRIKTAMESIENRSIGFQRTFLEMIYSLYPKDFVIQVAMLAKKTSDPKFLAMCCEYLFLNNKTGMYAQELLKRIEDIGKQNNNPAVNAFISVLQNKMHINNGTRPSLKDLISNSFLPNEMVIYSFQRKNRNYPGLAMVRNKDGKFIKLEDGKYFNVPQLARSCSNMPGYITNGNTPQGIFKVFGFGTSKSTFIGPTTNIQMVLPYENSIDVSDSVTRSLGDNYRFLLPVSWKNYIPIYEAYYAGRAGRTEIIAHGTTVNPAYYKEQPFYPLTPTQGCLCTKEIWSAIDGIRMESDQQKLVSAVNKAGGANGYCIVLEIDDQQKPVNMKEILPFLK
jgi:hypothetical protein